MGDLNTTWAIEIARGLASGGTRTACIAPGSRSTPLALAVDAHPAIASRSVIDERSAAFYALGSAKATGRPAIVVTTSGTAVAELLPAVVEAHEGHVPLVLVTADRPTELRGTGANQTIDQTRVFAPFVRWEEDLPAPTEAGLASLAGRAADAVGAAWIPPAGPVHLNVPLRKPLEPDTAGQEALRRLAAGPGPGEARAPGPLTDPDPLPPLDGDRGLIVVGPRLPDGLRAPLLELAAALQVPLLADGLSDVRFGPDGHRAVTAHDLFLADRDLSRRLRPDWVLQFGASPTSASLHRFLSLHGTRRYRIDEAGRRRDDIPGRIRMLHGPPAALVEGLLDRGGTGSEARETWHQAWMALETAARSAEDEMRAASPDAETAWVDAVVGTTPRVFVGNSLPVRDLERFGRPRPERVEVHANRGASGIDGTIATPAGIAAAAGPTTAVIGDVAFQHDVGSLACVPDGLRLVVIDNGGGRIFQHLPIADHPRFDDLFLTRPQVDIGKACAAFGLDHAVLDAPGPDAMRAQMRGTAQVVQVRTDGVAAAAFRKAVAGTAGDAARAALDSAGLDAR